MVVNLVYTANAVASLKLKPELSSISPVAHLLSKHCVRVSTASRVPLAAGPKLVTKPLENLQLNALEPTGNVAVA